MFDKVVLSTLEEDVGSDVLDHLFLLLKKELEAQYTELKQFPLEIESDRVRDVLHVIKNTSGLYGVKSLNLFAEDLYQQEVIKPSDVDNLCKIIRDTLSAVPISQEV